MAATFDVQPSKPGGHRGYYMRIIVEFRARIDDGDIEGEKNHDRMYRELSTKIWGTGGDQHLNGTSPCEARSLGG